MAQHHVCTICGAFHGAAEFLSPPPGDGAVFRDDATGAWQCSQCAGPLRPLRQGEAPAFPDVAETLAALDLLLCDGGREAREVALEVIGRAGRDENYTGPMPAPDRAA
jgi:hypothetical protein